MQVNARMIVGLGEPTDDGRRLAKHVLDEHPTLHDVEINVCDCRAGLLISAFFLSFLQQIHEDSPELLDKARKIPWITRYPFQQDNVARWMEVFNPE